MRVNSKEYLQKVQDEALADRAWIKPEKLDGWDYELCVGRHTIFDLEDLQDKFMPYGMTECFASGKLEKWLENKALSTKDEQESEALNEVLNRVREIPKDSTRVSVAKDLYYIISGKFDLADRALVHPVSLPKWLKKLSTILTGNNPFSGNSQSIGFNLPSPIRTLCELDVRWHALQKEFYTSLEKNFPLYQNLLSLSKTERERLIYECYHFVEYYLVGDILLLQSKIRGDVIKIMDTDKSCPYFARDMCLEMLWVECDMFSDEHFTKLRDIVEECFDDMSDEDKDKFYKAIDEAEAKS